MCDVLSIGGWNNHGRVIQRAVLWLTAVISVVTCRESNVRLVISIERVMHSIDIEIVWNFHDDELVKYTIAKNILDIRYVSCIKYICQIFRVSYYIVYIIFVR